MVDLSRETSKSIARLGVEDDFSQGFLVAGSSRLSVGLGRCEDVRTLLKNSAMSWLGAALAVVVPSFSCAAISWQVECDEAS